MRQKAFDKRFAVVSGALRERLPDSEVVPCYWGDKHGATLSAGGASIPRLWGTRGPGDDAPQEQATAEWGLLFADPLCELRVVAGTEHGDEADAWSMPGVEAAGERVTARLAALRSDGLTAAEADTGTSVGELAALLDATGLLPTYPGALEGVADSAEFAAAAEAADDDTAAATVAVLSARAILAHALAEAGEDALCTGEERDRMAELLSGLLGGGARAGLLVTAALAALAVKVSAQAGMGLLRTPLTKSSTPALGDILRYQAKGEPLRTFLAEHICTAPPDGSTVVIGHSLGGVALVDLLALRQLPQVGLLVTVGSQAAFLHELGALTGLPPLADTLPPAFPRWLNVYDRYDLLAYRAGPVFPKEERISDYEVNSRQPFPLSHSAYWRMPNLYDRIVAEAAGPGVART
ncbi:hypothetical protein ACFWCA_35950 [Streptomyces phaeochromogenes]|uniref:hypothetical protein n=1 Tax=Streptomyces phaeochromogenes TaxID=1923 RepID=UPI0036A9241E